MKNQKNILIFVIALLCGMLLSSVLDVLNIPNIFTVILKAIFG